MLGQFKGSFRDRAPIVKLCDVNIKLARTYKYLGITFGAQLSIADHLQALQSKSISALTALAKAVHSVWGLKFPLMRLYYRNIFLAIVTYGAAAWADLLTVRNIRQLLTLQRHPFKVD